MSDIQRLPLEVIRERIAYDPETGVFTWLVGRYAGKEAGHIMKDGYRRITLTHNDKRAAHRLAWLMTHGVIPAKGIDIDHANGNKSDNRIANLRLATRSQNARNAKRRKSSRTGYKGVDIHQGRYRAQIGYRRKNIFLGYFDDPEAAHQAYIEAARLMFREFANNGGEFPEITGKFRSSYQKLRI